MTWTCTLRWTWSSAPATSRPTRTGATYVGAARCGVCGDTPTAKGPVAWAFYGGGPTSAGQRWHKAYVLGLLGVPLAEDVRLVRDKALLQTCRVCLARSGTLRMEYSLCCADLVLLPCHNFACNAAGSLCTKHRCRQSGSEQRPMPSLQRICICATGWRCNGHTFPPPSRRRVLVRIRDKVPLVKPYMNRLACWILCSRAADMLDLDW